MSTNYKQKYLDIRAKHLKDTDVAYRLGYETGLKEGSMQGQMQAMQQQQQMMMQQQGQPQMDENGQPIPPEEGMEGQPQMDENGQPMEEMPPQMDENGQPMEEMPEEGGGELDQHISELEEMVSKGEKPKVTDLRKAINALAALRQDQIDKLQTKKKTTVHPNKSFVKDIVAKFETKTKSVTNDLEDIIKEHGITIED